MSYQYSVRASATLRNRAPAHNLQISPRGFIVSQIINCKTVQTPGIIPTLAPATIQANVLAPSSADYCLEHPSTPKLANLSEIKY